MKNVMKLIMVFAMLFVFTNTAKAQDKNDPKARAKVVTNTMKNTLSLTDEQYGKVYDVNLEFLTASQELRGSRDRDAKLQQAKVIGENRDQKLKAVLTPEQFEKYITTKREKRESSILRSNQGLRKQ